MAWLFNWSLGITSLLMSWRRWIMSCCFFRRCWSAEVIFTCFYGFWGISKKIVYLPASWMCCRPKPGPPMAQAEATKANRTMLHFIVIQCRVWKSELLLGFLYHISINKSGLSERPVARPVISFVFFSSLGSTLSVWFCTVLLWYPLYR